jgi:hypothetical protein
VQPQTNGIASTHAVIIMKGNIAVENICFHFKQIKRSLDARQRNITVRLIYFFHLLTNTSAMTVKLRNIKKMFNDKLSGFPA